MAENPPSSSRDATFDIVKGIGILEVMLHHLLSYSARKYVREGGAEWFCMTILHQALHFAVPTFLLISALLLTKSLMKRNDVDWRRFFLRRAQRTLAPYLVWTAIYLAFRLIVIRVDTDIAPRSVGGVALPALLTSRSEWSKNLLWGKSYFHLYFLSILLQFSLLFPLLFGAIRRKRLPFFSMMCVAFMVQLTLFWLYAQLIKPRFGFENPASTVFWYAPPLLLGAWVGAEWGRWEEQWRRCSRGILLLTAMGGVGYMTLAVGEMRGSEANGMLYNGFLMVYTTGMGLCLLALAQRIQGYGVGQALARIGNWSLPLFLLHPLALYYLGGPKITTLFQRIPSVVLVPALACALFAITWGMAWLSMRSKTDRALFGRSLSDTAQTSA